MRGAQTGHEKEPNSVPKRRKRSAGVPRPAKKTAQTEIQVEQNIDGMSGGSTTGASIKELRGNATFNMTFNLISQSGPKGLESITAATLKQGHVTKDVLRGQGAKAGDEALFGVIGAIAAAAAEGEAQGVPISPKAAYDLGMLAAYRRDYEAALGYFRRATHGDPEYSDAFEAIAWLQQAMAWNDLNTRRDCDGAATRLKEAWHAAKQTDPLAAGMMALRGYVAGTWFQLAQAKGDREAQEQWNRQAARLFEEALELDPGNASAQNGLGNALQVQGQWDAAIAAHLRATELNPRYASAWHDLAIAYEHKMEQDRVQATEWRQKALQAWLQAYRLAPDDVGFSPEAVVEMGRHVSALEQKGVGD